MTFDDDAPAKNSSQPAVYSKKQSRSFSRSVLLHTKIMQMHFLVTERLYIRFIRHTRPIVFLCKNIVDNGSERNWTSVCVPRQKCLIRIRRNTKYHRYNVCGKTVCNHLALGVNLISSLSGTETTDVRVEVEALHLFKFTDLDVITTYMV